MTLNGKEMREFDGTRVKIMVTSACNTACKHCCLGFSGTMAPDVLEEMISSLSPRYELRLDGSELLLDDRYVRLMKRIGQDNVLTNGRILLQKPEHIIELLRENGIRMVFLSYHYGIQGELNDIPLPDVEQAAATVRNAGFRLGLMTTVTKKNRHLVREVCWKAGDLGASFIQINPVVLQGRAREYLQEDTLNETEREQLRRDLAQLIGEYRNVLEIDVGKALEMSGKDPFYCRAVNKKVWIGVDNLVYPCIYLIEPGMAIGEYRDGKVWVERSVCWGSRRCAAEVYCNERRNLWGRGRF